ncbi:MAG: branched-chain amino acid ABC transporter permease [Burkholderiales bacterium]|nr:branched-chain amino acid ABC transporter permease [Anaerolineae bacterium]
MSARMNAQAITRTSPLATWVGVGIVAAVVVAIILLLEASGSAFWQGIFITLGMFIILAVSLNLASGFTGVFSLGHIGFMALGAYIAAILTLPVENKEELLNLPGWLATIHLDFTVGSFPLGFLTATLIAGLIASLLAVVVGAVLMRLSGHFVAVATLGFLVIVRVVLINADDFTRGARTFSNVTPYTDLWWVYGWAAVTLYTIWRIKFSAYGRAMFAQREDVAAARSVGIVIMRSRLFAFVVSAFFTAVAGSLWGHFITSFSPNAFYFDLTFRVITMLVVGGMGSVSGSVVGPVLITALAEALRRLEDYNQLYGISGISLALLFLIIIIFRPNGLMGSREFDVEWLGQRVLRALSFGRRREGEKPERFPAGE